VARKPTGRSPGVAAAATPPPQAAPTALDERVEGAAEALSERTRQKADESNDDHLARLARESRKILFEKQLQAPFHAKEVKWKAQTVKGERALAVGYVDARLVADRLDDVLGVDGWEDRYTVLADGSVLCHLTITTGGAKTTKCDVGSPSEQPDAGDRLKAAFSDAFKRAAVKFGIGRYLYRLPPQWVDYDSTKKQIRQLPQVPAWALPDKKVPDPRPYYDGDDQGPGVPAPVIHEARTAGDVVGKPADAAATTDPQQLKSEKDATELRDREFAKEQTAKATGTDKKRAEEFQATRLSLWIRALDGCDGPAQMTQYITENLPDEPVQTKAIVWDKVQSYIKNANLKWDPKTKEVYDPKDASSGSEAIPF
jgi:hypothetical protein